MKNIAVIVCLVLGLWGCGTKQADNSLVLNFEGRSIDIAPYFKGFPYSIFTISKDGSKLLFFKTGEKQTLQWMDIAKGADLCEAKDVVDVDFATRNGWHAQYNAMMVWFIGLAMNIMKKS